MQYEMQGLPLAEANVTAGAVSLVFDDTHSQDSDASNTHLKLKGQKLDMLLEFMQDAVATKVAVTVAVASSCADTMPFVNL